MSQAHLLEYYNRELAYLRELGAEFASAFPGAAAQLGMRGTQTEDPFVERLLEGFSFLTARIHLKMDAEFPRFSERLLDLVYPHYLSPLPCMAIVALQPSLSTGSTRTGYTLPAGSALKAELAESEQTPCEFRTAHEMTLWPLEITDAKLTADASALPLSKWPLAGQRPGGALHITLRAHGVEDIRELPIDKLTFFVSAQETIAGPLLERVVARNMGACCHADADGPRDAIWLGTQAVRHEGFEADQAMLPWQQSTFEGYRLLHEYFAFPERLLFFSITNLGPALRTLSGPTFTLTVLLDSPAPELERAVDARSLALHCTPAINLFERRTDHIAVSPSRREHHLVVDRMLSSDFEIFSVRKITGIAQSSTAGIDFFPFSGAAEAGPSEVGRYFSMRREPRHIAQNAFRSAARAAYPGSEVFVSLVDQNDAPYPDSLRHISGDVLCTNRHLPLSMPRNGKSDFTLRAPGPVDAIKILRGPTAPRPAPAQGLLTWRLISHLGLDYLGLVDADERAGAQTLRELLHLYADGASPGLLAQIDGVCNVRVAPVYRRLPHAGPAMVGRGVCVSVALDELAFAGGSTYLFETVLEQFLARHVSINSFTELDVSTLQRGKIRRWPSRIGRRPIL